MFLLTMVLILISMLGVYTQVYALEAARLLASQTTMGTILVNWHATAANVAGNAMNASAAGVNGCSLTPGTGSQCLTSSSGYVYPASSPALVTGSYSNSATGISMVPPANIASTGYPYIWNSVAYTPSPGVYYVLTYVTPPPSGSHNIYVSTATSPTPTQLNLSLSDIYRQLRNMGIPSYSFGYVSGNTLNVAPVMINSTLTPISYPLPTGFTIPAGSLGIISSPGQCSSC